MYKFGNLFVTSKILRHSVKLKQLHFFLFYPFQNAYELLFHYWKKIELLLFKCQKY